MSSSDRRPGAAVELGRPDRAAGGDANPYTVPVEVEVLYTRGLTLLVGLRQGGFAARQWDTSGKLEPGEPLEHGMAREAFEETGLRLPPQQLQVVSITTGTHRTGCRGSGCTSTSRPTQPYTASR